MKDLLEVLSFLLVPVVVSGIVSVLRVAIQALPWSKPEHEIIVYKDKNEDEECDVKPE